MVSVVAFEVHTGLTGRKHFQSPIHFNHRFILEFCFFISGTPAEPSPVRVMNTFMEMTGSPDPAKVMQMLQSMGPEDQDMDIIEKLVDACKSFCFVTR